MNWDAMVRTADGIKELTFADYGRELIARLCGREYKTKHWSNYPYSVFFYFADDEVMQNEIGIYTHPTAWAIYVDSDIQYFKVQENDQGSGGGE